MLNKLSRYVIVLLIVVVSALYLPDFFSVLFDKKVDTPRIDYSAVINEFVYHNYHGMGQIDYGDIAGNTYSEREYFQLLPFTYHATLEKWQQLPEEIGGFELSSKNIRKNSQFISIRPKDINPPSVPLYILFESESEYAQLQIPEDVFRLDNKLEFIDPVTNSVIEEKSERFQQALLDAGFQFPAGIVAGNPTNRKPFDEGYFIRDAKGDVYQMKMAKGEPVCIKTGIDPELDIRQIFIGENLRKEFYGSLLTEDNEVYLIMYDGYRLQKIQTNGKNDDHEYEADETSFRLYTYPVNRHVRIIGDGFTRMIVLTNDFEYIDEHVETWTPYDKRTASIVKQFLFPFELSTYTPEKHIRLQMDYYWPRNLAGIGLSLLALVLFSRRRPWLDYVVVLLTGVFGLIGVLLVGHED